MPAGIAIFAVVLSLSGPLITFHCLPLVWAVSELCALVTALMFLGLTCLTDPGFIEQSPTRDPLILQLQELERKKLEHATTITIKVVHEGIEYKRILNGGWTRLEPGAVLHCAAASYPTDANTPVSCTQSCLASSRDLVQRPP